MLEVLGSGLPAIDQRRAGSYLGLAQSAYAVVSGDVLSAVRVTTRGRSFIELVVANVSDLEGTPRADIDVIAYDAAWDQEGIDPLTEVVELNGVRFVGFLSPWSGVRGGWSPGVEGLYLACSDTGPLQPVLQDARGSRDPSPVSVQELRALLGAQLLQIEREAEAVAEERARLAAQRAAALASRQPLAALVEARAIWKAANLGVYRYRYIELATAGMGARVEVLVENGEATLVDRGRASSESSAVWTVDDIFDLIEAADDIREVAFDPTLGYPTLVNIDPDNTVGGDEITVIATELFSIAQIDAAAADLQTWFPESTKLPPELIEAQDRFGAEPTNTEISTAYLLHAFGDLEMYLSRADGDVCLLAVRRSPESASDSIGSIASGCQSETKFGLDGDWTAQTNDFGQRSYLLIVPPARYFREQWKLAVDSERSFSVDITERSALVVFGPEGAAETVVATVECECGELSYSFRLQANEPNDDNDDDDDAGVN